jgi:hypothetical protein
MKSQLLAGAIVLTALSFPASAQTPPAEEVPVPPAPAEEVPMSKLPGAVPEASVAPAPLAAPAVEAPTATPEAPQVVSAPPPPPAQAVYPPCTATLKDQCTNSPQSRQRVAKRQPRARR